MIHLGSHLNLRLIVCFSFRPLPLLRQGVLRCCFHSRATFFAGTSQPELEVPAQISRCASGAGGRTCQSEAARMGWRGVLAQRTPPMRAAAKRRSQAELGGGVGPRRGVYGALAGRLTAERREAIVDGLLWELVWRLRRALEHLKGVVIGVVVRVHLGTIQWR